MDVEEEELITKFKEISNKKWIKSISNSFGSIGLTFEKELEKKADSLYFPDYCGIELKCTSRYSRYPLYLFAAAFDGPTFVFLASDDSSYVTGQVLHNNGGQIMG